jgi:hypothetical protein
MVNEYPAIIPSPDMCNGSASASLPEKSRNSKIIRLPDHFSFDNPTKNVPDCASVVSDSAGDEAIANVESGTARHRK